MFEPGAVSRRLIQRLETQLPPDGLVGTGIFSLTLALSGIRFPGLPDLPPDWFYWAHPESEHYLLGFGLIPEPVPRQEDPTTLDRVFRRCTSQWHHADPDDTTREPLAFVGFSFDTGPHRPAPASSWGSFPALSLYYPEILLRRRDGGYSITFSCRRNGQPKREVIARWSERVRTLFEALAGDAPRSGRRTSLNRLQESPDPAAWLRLALEARQAIQNGDLNKIVLARMIRVQAERPLLPARLMAVLDCLYPSSRLIACSLGQQVLASASPERLVSLENGQVRCDAVAGTINRAAAEEEDRNLADRLLRDPKTRREHAIVVKALSDTLKPLCNRLYVPEKPGVFRLRNLQHLYSELSGDLRDGGGLLATAFRLHPTPAVSGAPQAEACRWLARHEPITRGWYSGGAGWIDRAGDGEIQVLLRCALLRGSTAELYAGAGVLAESDEQAELAETELKLGAMLEALENA